MGLVESKAGLLERADQYPAQERHVRIGLGIDDYKLRHLSTLHHRRFDSTTLAVTSRTARVEDAIEPAGKSETMITRVKPGIH